MQFWKSVLSLWDFTNTSEQYKIIEGLTLEAVTSILRLSVTMSVLFIYFFPIIQYYDLFLICFLLLSSLPSQL